MDVVGAREAAELIGVRPSNFLRDWVSRPDFPAPVTTLRRGRLWARKDVADYLRLMGRRRGVRSSMLQLSPPAARWLPTIKRRIVREIDPDRIILFGSQARGDAGPDSDIDLLVVVGDNRDRRNLAEVARVSVADVDVDKDVFVTSPAQIRRYGDVIGSILEPAMREGVTIYARA